MHYFPLMYSSYSSAMMSFLPSSFIPFIPLIVVWTLAIKGFALWHAARNSQTWWFIALLIVNTLGILEIIYLVWFRAPSSDTVSSSSSAA